MRPLLVSEEFTAPQGEGPNMGRPMYWVRLGGCNLACKWCDANYAVFFDKRHAMLHESGEVFDPHAELSRVEVADLAARISCSNLRTVAVTGGEPLLQQEAVTALIDHPLMGGNQFEFETAGTIAPDYYLAGYRNVRFNVSPKLSSSGNAMDRRRDPDAIAALLGLDSVFKFVLDTRSRLWQSDLTEVEYLCRTWHIPPDRTWLMPCGITPDEVTRGMLTLEPVALARGWNLSARLQVFMHGDQRGY